MEFVRTHFALSRLGLCVIFFICLLLILGNSGCLTKTEGNPLVSSVDERIFYQTLNQFDEARPGYGFDASFTKEPFDQPKAYALYASAEARRFQGTGNKTALKNAIHAANWLVLNSDLDGDGDIGWGLPFPWDAGGDGTINPENTEYAIQTAVGVQALLDVYDAAEKAGSDEDVSGFLTTATDAMETFLNGKFDEDSTGVIFWYSTRPEDSYHVINSGSMLAGQLQRLSRYPVANQSRFSELADRCVLYILSRQQQDSDGNPYWMYYDGMCPRSLTQNRPKDLLHEVYTLQGLFDYRIYGGRYNSSIDPKAMLSTLNRFFNGSKLYDLSVGYPYTSNWQTEATRWARVWSAGYALNFAVRLESYLNEPPVMSTMLATALVQNYRKDGQWLLRPDDNKTRLYPRQMAFVLNGLAFYEFAGQGENPLINNPYERAIRNETSFPERTLFPFTLRVSGANYVKSSLLLSLDENGNPVTDYGDAYDGAGRRYNPYFIANYALALYRDYRSTGNDTFKEQFDRQVKWFLDHKITQKYRGSEFWTWKYDFDNLVFGAHAPWISSLAQGNALCVFLAAYDLTNDSMYLDAAECTFRSFLVPTWAGGVTSFENNVTWFEEVAGVDAPSSKILNGHIIAVQSLWTFWKWTGREDAKRYLDLGISAVRRDLALYDAGYLSYYSQYPDAPRRYADAGSYNWLHVRQLVWLYEVTDETKFLEYALRFAGYDSPCWNITAAGSNDPDLHGTDGLSFHKGKYWSHSQIPTWIQIDLGTPQVIDGLAFHGPIIDDVPRDFQFFVSADGENWKLILERSGNNNQYYVERFEPMTVRFAKLVISSVNNGSKATLSGFAVLRPETAPSAVSDWESIKFGQMPGRAFNVGWKIPRNGWFIADLGHSPCDLAVEVIKAKGQCSFSLLQSNDLKTFNSINLAALVQTKDGKKIALSGMSSRYLKIELHEDSKGGTLYIRRIS